MIDKCIILLALAFVLLLGVSSGPQRQEHAVVAPMGSMTAPDIVQRTCALEVVLTILGAQVPEAAAVRIAPVHLPEGVVSDAPLLACMPLGAE